MKKIFLVLLILVFFTTFKIAKASVVISEVMYAPANGSNFEWIEIYNNGNDPVDLNGWRFFNSKDSSYPLHSAGSFILEPNTYALITGSDNTEVYSCQVFTVSNFSLPDDSSRYQTYKGIYSGSDETTGGFVTYDTSLGGGKDSGTSLSRIDSVWKAGMSTPGMQNQISNDNNEENLNTDNEIFSVDSNENISKTKSKITESKTIKVKILANNITFTGKPLEFNSSILGYSNEKIILGKLYWNFGDGTSLEQINKFDKFFHTYLYPGEYALSLEYYSSSFAEIPDAVSKIILKVVPLTVSISKVGSAEDFFIELTNNSAYDIDISKWVLSSFGKNFIFPKNTIIMAKKSVKVPGGVSGFVLGNEQNLKLSMPTGEVVDIYGGHIFSNKNTFTNSVINKNKDTEETYTNNKTEDANDPFSNNNLDANAIDSDKDINNFYSNFAFLGGLVVLLGFASYVVYFLRKKKVYGNTGDDFEILDE